MLYYIEAKLLNRKSIGVDINKRAIDITKNNITFKMEESFEPILKQGDACNLNFIKNNSIDLICTHPPYADIIKYSQNLTKDLSLQDYNKFLYSMKSVASESNRVLKENKYCAVLIGDIRKQKHVIPLGFSVMDVFLKAGFVLKEIAIKKQHNCKMTQYWINRSKNDNFLLLAHEYLFIFRKKI